MNYLEIQKLYIEKIIYWKLIALELICDSISNRKNVYVIYKKKIKILHCKVIRIQLN